MPLKHVNGYGPLDARVLHVGEGPGREEEDAGRPFVGRTGQGQRRMYKKAGVDPDSVRWNNVSPTRDPVPKDVRAMCHWVHGHWANLGADLALAKPRVVVAQGRAALYRLTGKTDILRQTGGVWSSAQLPTHVQGREVGLPPGCVVIACLHPASVMRTKTGARWAQVAKATERAAAWARRDTRDVGPFPVVPPVEYIWDGATLRERMRGAKACAIDTEFNPETGEPFMVGLTVDGRNVLNVALNEGCLRELGRQMMRTDLEKAAHSYWAEIRSLLRLGLDTRNPWWDTLEAFSHLYSDLPVSLSSAMLFYEDGWNNWKWMPMGAEYNALDVIAGWRVWQHTKRELLAEPALYEAFSRERMPCAALFGVWEDRGLAIDEERRAAKVEENTARDVMLTERVRVIAQAYFDKRVAAEREMHESAERRVAEFDAKHAEGVPEHVRCRVKKHETYDGLRKKRWSKDPECTCKVLYEMCVGRREARAALMKARMPYKARIKRWESTGFDPGNHDHVKWLLYTGFGLPKQYKHRKVSTDADARAKLMTLQRVHDDEDMRRIITDVEEVQHLRKVRSSFLFADKRGMNAAKIDARGVVHPPKRLWGTGSGRVAGGASDEIGDRAPSPYAFNDLNIPEEARDIYVPRDDTQIEVGVGGRVQNVEDDIPATDDDGEGAEGE